MLALLALLLPAAAMPLGEALDAAEARSPALLVSSARLEEAEARVREATANLLPSASLSGGASWQNRVLFPYDDLAEQMSSAIGDALADAGLPFDVNLEIDPDSFGETEIQPGFQWVGQLQARQALLAPGAWLYRRAALEGVDLARAQEEVDRYTLDAAVVEAWHGSALAHALLEVAERAVERAERVRELARAAVELGVLPGDGALPAEEAVASARAALERARAGAETADRALERLTGLPGPADPPEPPPELPALDRLLASLDRPDLELADARVEAAQAMKRASLAPALPSLGLTGSLTYLDPAPYFAEDWNYKLVLGVQVPLVQGGRVRAQRAEAEARLAQARAGRDALRERAELEVTRAHGVLAGALASLEQREKALELAEKAEAAAEARFQDGGASLLELERARARVVQAELQLVQARAEAARAADLLELAVGHRPRG